MAHWSTLKTQIATRITNNVTSIKKVYKYGIDMRSAEIADFPVAYVLPVESPSFYLSQNFNERSYVFRVWVLAVCEAVNLETTQTTIEDAVDDIIDLFDSDTHNTLGDNVAFIEAAPSNFDQIKISSSQIALITSCVLRCHYLKDVQS